MADATNNNESEKASIFSNVGDFFYAITKEENIQEENDEVILISVCKNSITPIDAGNRGEVSWHRELPVWKENDKKGGEAVAKSSIWC